MSDSRVEAPYDPDLVPLEVLKEVTPGEGVPDAISDGEGGIRSTTRVTAEMCAAIRQLRPHLPTKEIAELLGYSPSTISKHAHGNCQHSEEESDTPDATRRSPGNDPDNRVEPVTDRDTMVVTASGSSHFHKNAGGEPACGHGRRAGKSRPTERDAVEAYVWKEPCKVCFWRHYAEGKYSRRIAELEYELAKRRREDADGDE